MKIKKLSVDDSKRTRERNESRAKKGMKYNEEGFEQSVGKLRFAKTGAANLWHHLGNEGIEMLLDTEIKSNYIAKRFNLNEGDRLNELINEMPKHSSLDISFINKENICRTIWVKEGDEDSEKGTTVKVILLDISFND